jgi:endonuclease YncB( thermonuclease family)
VHRVFHIARIAAAAVSLTGPIGLATAQEARIKAEACTLHAGPARSVVRVIDAETVLLDDHQEVRLIGALAPRSPDFSPTAAPWPPEEAAIAALKSLVQGRSVSIATSGRARDRYGRQLAHLFVEDGGERIWVQGEMLAAGHARAYGLPGSYACMRELMAHERVARDEYAGLWSSAAYAVRSARATRNLLRRRNSYEIVAGTVAKVAPTKARTYVNFGSDWRRDFTAGIEARVLRANPGLTQMLAGLEGKRVEVRGWIQYRNGPYIDIEDPSQIAIADAALPGVTPPPPGAETSSDRVPDTPPGKEKRPAPSAPGALDL